MKKTGIYFPDSETFQSNHFVKLLRKKKVLKVVLPCYDSESFDFFRACENGFVHPFLVTGRDENFGISLPDSSCTFQEVATAIGRNTPVRLIDVDTQSEIIRYTIGEYADYLSDTSDERKTKILNMISLEFSNSPFGDEVSPPRFVHKIDWMHTVWPLDCIADANFCRVERYCLVGMAGSYTDFHIDFGGTSVWYHILRGKKRFYLAPPTNKNLMAYEKWTCSPNQSTSFLGDNLEDCFYFDLVPGNTLIIPSGWIHSVYTPEDSIVFGGNFLHSYSILPQLQANEIELRTKVSKAFTHPQFMTSHYYFLSEMFPHFQQYLQDIKSSNRSIDDDYILHVVSSSFVIKQIPFLLMSISRWIGDSATLDSSQQDALSLISDWWQLLEGIGESLQANSLLSLIAKVRSETFSSDFLFSDEWIELIYELQPREVFMRNLKLEQYDPQEYDCWKLPERKKIDNSGEANKKKRHRFHDEDYGEDEDIVDDESFCEDLLNRERSPETKYRRKEKSPINIPVIKNLTDKKSKEIRSSSNSGRSALLQKLYGKKK